MRDFASMQAPRARVYRKVDRSLVDAPGNPDQSRLVTSLWVMLRREDAPVWWRPCAGRPTTCNRVALPLGALLVLAGLPACNVLAGIDEPMDLRVDGARESPPDSSGSRPGRADAHDSSDERRGSEADAAEEARVGDASSTDGRCAVDDCGHDGDDASDGDSQAASRIDASEHDPGDGSHLPDAAGSTDGPSADRAASGGPDGAPTGGEPGNGPGDGGGDASQEWPGSGSTATLRWSLVSSPDAQLTASTGDGRPVRACAAIDGTCALSVPVGTTVTLTASVTAGAAIASWSGCDSNDRTICKVTVDRLREVSAEVLRGHTLRIESTGAGSGTVSARADSRAVFSACAGPCEAVLSEKAVVVLSATSALGSVLAGWSDGVTANPRTLVMDTDRLLGVEFAWTPAALETLRLWLDADYGVQANASQRVARWSDRSRTATSLEALDTDSQPFFEIRGIQSHPAVRFAGAQSLINRTTLLDAEDKDFVLTVVASNESASDGVGVLWNQRQQTMDRTWDEMTLAFRYNQTVAITAEANGCWQVGDTAKVETAADQDGGAAPHILTMRRTNFAVGTNMDANLSLRVDGVEVGNGFTKGMCAGTGNVALGARVIPHCVPTCTPTFGDFLKGQIAELVYAVDSTSYEDIVRVERYLAAKYGLRGP